MLYYLLAAGLVLHAFFWGAGLAWLAVPRPWRRWWWLFAPALGASLQTAVVWAGAHAALPGARSYAWWAELVPLALLGLALVRVRGGAAGMFRSLRTAGGAAGLAVAMGVAGWFLLSPMAQASRGLTTTSLGSTDQANLAAGARVLQEFARDDRIGFLDQPEVTEVLGVKSFHDYWLKLGSFVPAALIAHNGALFGVEPRRMVSVLGVTLVLVQLPLVFFLARALMGLRGLLAAGLAGVIGLSPLVAYAVHHGGLGPLGAAAGIMLVTLALGGAGRAAFAGRSVWRWLPLLLAGLWLTAGSDGYFLPWIAVPAVTWLVLEAVRRANLRAAGLVGLMAVVAVELLAVFFWDRIDGVILRRGAGEAVAAGWPMPRLTPEAWLGFVSGPALEPWSRGLRLGLGVLLVLGWLAGLVAAWRRQPGIALAGASFVLVILVGWRFGAASDGGPLAAFEGWRYAITFLPLFLAGALAGAAGRRRRSPVGRVAVAATIALLAVNLAAAEAFRRRMGIPPLRVDRALVEIGQLEADARIRSVNVRIEDPWARLWANAFLLRKPQYFEVHRYEARRATALRGEWDLLDTQLWVRPAAADDFVALNRRFHAVRVEAPDRLHAAFGPTGWYQEERGGDQTWRWSDGSAQIEIHNPRFRPQPARLELQVRSAQPGTFRLELDGRELVARPLGDGVEAVQVDLALPAGRSQLAVRFDRPPISPPGDSRLLAVALYEFELSAVAPPTP